MKAGFNIDRLARQAKQEVKPEHDLLKLGVPTRVAGWQILVEPVTPKKTSAGGLVLIEETQQHEEILTKVGRVLKCGPTAMQGKTNSGIELCKLAEGIEKPADLIGLYVGYQRYTGHERRLRGIASRGIVFEKERLLIYLTATEILDIVDDPEDWVHHR